MAAKTKKTVAKKATETVLKTSKTATNAAEQTIAAFTKGFPQFQSFQQFQPFKLETDMFKGNKQFEKIAQGATSAGQEQMDAVMKSSTILAKGMEDMIKTCMEIAQESSQKSQSEAKSLMSCKTLNEFMDVQTRLAQSSFDTFMTNATRISEKAVKLSTEIFEPINDQMGKSMKRASDMAA